MGPQILSDLHLQFAVKSYIFIMLRSRSPKHNNIIISSFVFFPTYRAVRAFETCEAVTLVLIGQILARRLVAWARR